MWLVLLLWRVGLTTQNMFIYTGCRLCAHAGCHQLFNFYQCSEVDETMVKSKEEIIKVCWPIFFNIQYILCPFLY